MDHGPGDRRRSDLGGRPGPRPFGAAGSSPRVAPLHRIVGARGLHWLVHHVTGRAEARSDERPPRPHRSAPLLRCGVWHCRVLVPVHRLNWVVLAVFAWQFHHFQKQNLGLVALAATSAGLLGPRPLERRLIMFAGMCGIAALLSDPRLLQLDMYRPLNAVTATAFMGYVATLVVGSFALFRTRTRGKGQASYCALVSHGAALPSADLHLPIALRRGERHDDRARTPVSDPDGPCCARTKDRWPSAPRVRMGLRNRLGRRCRAEPPLRTCTFPGRQRSVVFSASTSDSSACTSWSTPGCGASAGPSPGRFSGHVSRSWFLRSSAASPGCR